MSGAGLPAAADPGRHAPSLARPAIPPPLDASTFEARTAGTPLLLLLDVDGTLAPIVPRPEEAQVPPETRAALAGLAGRPGVVVALLTGRAATDAARLVGVPGLWVIGNHGVETVDPAGVSTVAPAARPWREPLARAAAALAAAVGDVPGAWVEDKGWSLALHHRHAARESIPALQARAEAIAAGEGLRYGTGKEVVELKVPAAVDKGTAALALAARVGADHPGSAILVAGDDVTDEDAFRRLRDALPWALAVRVGAGDAPTHAECRVPDPDAVRALLERLADRRRG